MTALARRETELAEGCAALAARFPEAAELERLHRAAGTKIPAWRRMMARMRAGTGGLSWLRDAELELARAYTARHDPRATAAWQRYLEAEHLLAMAEFGDLSPA